MAIIKMNEKFVQRLTGDQAVMTCPICQSNNVEPFLKIIDVPVHVGILWPSESSARQCPRENIILGFCHSCGLITNILFDPNLMDYTQRYENSLDFSPFFQEYSYSLASRLIRHYNIFHKDLIEIGCGNGNFLKLLCQLGDNRGIGFDPSYDYNSSDNILPKKVTIIKDYYSEKYSNIKVDIIFCRQVLEHVHAPSYFLTMLHNTLRGKSHTVLYFEVPNVLHTLCNLAIWDIIYEHCSYFSPESLARAFTLHGFIVCKVKQTYKSQFLTLEALPREPGKVHQGEKTTNLNEADLSAISQEIRDFGEKHEKKFGFWREQLNHIKKTGQRAVVWGAGSKGVSFLNMLKTQDLIEYVVDINPHKQNMYVAGTGQQIVFPEFLQKYRPDIIIIMNEIYKKEIQQTVNGFGLEPIFLYA